MIEDERHRRYIQSCIRQYAYFCGIPRASWPDEEILRLSATDCVCSELVDRLAYQRNKSSIEIIDEYIYELKANSNAVSELSVSKTLRLLWEYSVSIAEELKSLYFPIGGQNYG